MGSTNSNQCSIVEALRPSLKADLESMRNDPAGHVSAAAMNADLEAPHGRGPRSDNWTAIHPFYRQFARWLCTTASREWEGPAIGGSIGK
jgi:hypothetical protein